VALKPPRAELGAILQYARPNSHLIPYRDNLLDTKGKLLGVPGGHTPSHTVLWVSLSELVQQVVTMIRDRGRTAGLA
jgi:glyoxylase-like metal-dependent hydrolase (beta-lactamase superfamily II)